jgi:hypothetical protein
MDVQLWLLDIPAGTFLRNSGTSNHEGEEKSEVLNHQEAASDGGDVLLYADGEDTVVYAEAARVVATLIEDAVDKLDPVQLRE